MLAQGARKMVSFWEKLNPGMFEGLYSTNIPVGLSLITIYWIVFFSTSLWGLTNGLT